MNVKFSPRYFALLSGAFLLTQGLVAQTTVQLFGPTNVATSNTHLTYPYSFNTTTLNLTCPAAGIIANLSGPSGGNLLVDNNIIVTVTPNGGPAQNAVNVCPLTDHHEGAGAGLYYEDCITSTYASAANGGVITGQNPDTYIIPGTGMTVDAAGGVGPISLVAPIVPTLYPANLGATLPTDPNAGSPVGLVPGQQSVSIAIVDDGGKIASSSINLTTNCTLGGVSSGTVSGNTISSDPTTQTQTFTFNSNPGGGDTPPQLVSFVYDVSKVDPDTIASNDTTPQTTDAPLAQSDFQTYYTPLTSFATSSCLIHTGEVLTDGVTPACKLYTLECIGQDGSKAGANCPISSLLNESVADVFDGPQFSLQNIYTVYGVFHEGIGFLMASDDWNSANGGPCAFDPNAGNVANLPCPQNLLTSFSGPGTFAGKGLTTNPNSTFVSIAGVPEDMTSIFVPGEWPDHWSNTRTPNVYFSSQAPNLSKGAYVLNSSNRLVPLTTASKYIPAPIHSITYGISPAGSPLPLPGDEPILTDSTLVNPAVSGGCPVPTPSSPGPKTQPNFTKGPVSLSFLSRWPVPTPLLCSGLCRYAGVEFHA